MMSSPASSAPTRKMLTPSKTGLSLSKRRILYLKDPLLTLTTPACIHSSSQMQLKTSTKLLALTPCSPWPISKNGRSSLAASTPCGSRTVPVLKHASGLSWRPLNNLLLLPIHILPLQATNAPPALTEDERQEPSAPRGSPL